MDALTVRFGPADVTAPGVADLIATHKAALRLHYDEEDCHALDTTALAEAEAQMHAAWDGDTVRAVGGLKPLGEGQVELKSMFTSEAARGRGVASGLLAHLLEAARTSGHSEILLEAGRSDDYAAPARALYARAGFAECPPFGDYVDRPASIFMHRDL